MTNDDKRPCVLCDPAMEMPRKMTRQEYGQHIQQIVRDWHEDHERRQADARCRALVE